MSQFIWGFYANDTYLLTLTRYGSLDILGQQLLDLIGSHNDQQLQNITEHLDLRSPEDRWTSTRLTRYDGTVYHKLNDPALRYSPQDIPQTAGFTVHLRLDAWTDGLKPAAYFGPSPLTLMCNAYPALCSTPTDSMYIINLDTGQLEFYLGDNKNPALCGRLCFEAQALNFGGLTLPRLALSVPLRIIRERPAEAWDALCRIDHLITEERYAEAEFEDTTARICREVARY